MFDKILCKGRKRKANNNTSKCLRFVDNLDEQLRKIFLRYLKGNIIINHCRGHSCIILLFDFKYFENNHRRLLSKKSLVDRLI